MALVKHCQCSQHLRLTRSGAVFPEAEKHTQYYSSHMDPTLHTEAIPQSKTCWGFVLDIKFFFSCPLIKPNVQTESDWLLFCWSVAGAAFWKRNTGIDWECKNHLGTLWPEDPSLSVTGRLWRQIGWYTAVKWQRICVVAISWWTPSEKYAQVKVQPFSADTDDTRANASQCPDRSCLSLFLAFYP